MDQCSDLPGSAPSDGAEAASARRVQGLVARLAVVSSPLRLAQDGDPIPHSWSASLADLTRLLGIGTVFVPAPDTAAPVFAPWAGWSAAAFQNGGCARLPDAQFVASYCIGHAGGASQGRGGVDVMLVSPHPAICEGSEGGLPGIGTLRGIIRAVVAEGRERIAIIVHARQQPALAAMRFARDRSLCPEGFVLDILAIEDALPALMVAGAPWDAIIAMPDLRSIVFTMLAETSGVCGPWPMLWHNRGLRRVTSEVRGEGAAKGASRLPLDASALIHALALTLHAAGKVGAALNLHEGWARLRGRGVTTAARGSDAPYAVEVTDAEFIALHQREIAAGDQYASTWRALENTPMINSGRQTPNLRVISSNSAE